MTDLTNLLAPFKARAEAATEGPWRTWIDDGERRGAAVETSWSHDADGSDTELITDWCSPSDAEFIAHARTDVPRLLAALEGVLALHQPQEMSEQVGYMVVEFNQASGQPSIPMAAEIEDIDDARVTKLYYEGVARKTGRRERYAIATLTIEDDE